MGCGISRDDGLDRRRTTELSVKEDQRLTKNNINAKHGGEDGLSSSSLPPIPAENIPPRTKSMPLALVHDNGRQHCKFHSQGSQRESWAIGRKKVEDVGDECKGVEREKAKAKSSSSIGSHYMHDDHQDYGEEEVDGRIFVSNLGDKGQLFMGSPSFREYCAVDYRSNDDIAIQGNIHSKKGEEMMQRVTASSNEGSSGRAAAAIKKRRIRSKKDSKPNHRLAALGSLIKRASCYNPNNNKKN